ncbi:MAG: hypothetical protein ACREBO_00780 [Novosphingobium sp.]
MALGLLVAAVLHGPACAQDAGGPTAEAAIAAQQQAYGPPDPRARCGIPDDDGDIVVCAADDKEFRVQSSRELNPTSHEATYDGLPRAPQLDKPSCAGQANCLSFGSVPPPVYYIDLEAIPEAPAGSDADLIAKGEKAER